MLARCACEITSYDDQRILCSKYAARVGVRSAGWRLRPPSEARRAAAAEQARVTAVEAARETSSASSRGAIVKPEAIVGAVSEAWLKAPLVAQVKALLQAGAPAEARALLLSRAEQGAPLTHFYLAVCVSQLQGEAAACEHYEVAATNPQPNPPPNPWPWR